MNIIMLKSKIHRITVTDCELDYDGSCAIDSDLMVAANIRPYEQLHIYNLTNGERFITYAIEAEPGSKIISLNGAAAHKADVGDLVIICTYANVEAEKATDFIPELVYISPDNEIMTIPGQIPPTLHNTN